MIALRRAPREVYRLYGEQEYLAGAGDGLQPTGTDVYSDGDRRARTVSVALLFGTAGAFLGVIALNTLPHASGAPGANLKHLGSSRLGAVTIQGAAARPHTPSAHVGVHRMSGDGHRRNRRSSVRPPAPGKLQRPLVAAAVQPEVRQPVLEPTEYPQRLEFGFER